jgi:peptidoglycan hydrolase CwlO-like protein
MKNETKNVIFVILCSIIFIFLIVSGIIDFLSGRKTASDIQSIRDQYNRIETAYSDIRTAVDGFNSKLDTIDQRYPDIEKSVGRLEAAANRLNKSVSDSQATVGQISGTVGNLEEANRQFAELIAEIVGSASVME